MKVKLKNEYLFSSALPPWFASKTRRCHGIERLLRGKILRLPLLSFLLFDSITNIGELNQCAAFTFVTSIRPLRSYVLSIVLFWLSWLIHLQHAQYDIKQ